MARRALVIGLSALLLFTQSGCGPFFLTTRSDPPYLRVPDRPRLGTIAVVAAQFAPEVELKFPPDDSSKVATGAAAGAGLGAAAWGVALLASLSACLFAPPGCGPALAPFLAIGAAAGTVVGATSADKSPESTITAKDAHAAANAALRHLNIQQAFQTRTTEYGRETTSLAFVTQSYPGPANSDERPSYASLRIEGIDNVLEIGVLSVGMYRVGWSHGILNVTARARFIRTSDGTAVHEAMYRFVSPPLTTAQWAENNAEGFRRTLDRAYEDLAEQAVDRLFLVYDPPTPREWAGGLGDCVRGPIRPENPKGSSPFCVPCFGGSGRAGPIWDRDSPFPLVDSLQPVLRWGTFPSAEDLKTDHGKVLERIAGVSYDLRLYEATLLGANRWFPGEQIYSRTTTSVAHRLELPLNACGRYFWTFRARFSMNGQPRATEWAGAYNTGYTECALPATPASPRSYHAFRTPCSEATK